MMRHQMRVGLLLLCLTIAGCAALPPFPSAARPGDTITVAVGWNATLSRGTTTVTISPADGSTILYPPGDPRVRAVLRLYPDPVSRLVVGTETRQALGTDADSVGRSLLETGTAQDRDWFLTVVILDLPPSLPPGLTAIALASGDTPLQNQPALVEILPQAGAPMAFALPGIPGGDPSALLGAFERADHWTVTFSGAVVPQAIQLELTHTPQVGTPWVINPRGDLKNGIWSDDGGTLRIALTPTSLPLGALSDFKIYIAGGVADLQVNSVKAYDRRGARLPGIGVDIR